MVTIILIIIQMFITDPGWKTQGKILSTILLCYFKQSRLNRRLIGSRVLTYRYNTLVLLINLLNLFCLHYHMHIQLSN